jgi:hypothetical protein
MVVINVNPQEDVETLDYLDQYVAKLDAQMDDNDMKRVVMLVVGMVMMKVVPIMMVEDVSGMKMMVIVWRKCFRPLDQRFY